MSLCFRLLLLLMPIFLAACSPVRPLITNQYKLQAFSAKPFANHYTRQSILVGMPEAAAGYQTDQMIYTKKSFELNAFVHNAWVDPPADMLLPLITQSLQHSGYFRAVASSSNAELTDYRIDTQLIELQQNFLVKPSVISFTAKIELSHIGDNRLVASRLIRLKLPCPMDTPYGGVIAANQAAQGFTAELTHFVINRIQHDKHPG